MPMQAPEGVPFSPGEARPEEFAPGLSHDLEAMAEQVLQVTKQAR
ncbi:hypothetical protein [Ktedonobacter sp. SOSP1-85]|nr:hypothetical protein [Ktedonobacter sp. SOSP1-85]